MSKKGFEINFSPAVPKPRPSSLIERLRETKDGFPQTGSGGIGSDGSGYIRMNPAPQVLINPDGEAAALAISQLIERRDELEAAGSRALELIKLLASEVALSPAGLNEVEQIRTAFQGGPK